MNKKKKWKTGRTTKRKIKKPALLKAIKIAGGFKALALDTGVTQCRFSTWLYTNEQIPSHHVPKIVIATKGKVRPEELRPDVYIIRQETNSK